MIVLARKSNHIHSGYKPEKEKYLNQKHHRVQSIQNETIVFSLFLSMECIEIVPDIDDDYYDDDNSLASLFCLCCAVLGRAHPCRGKHATLAELCEKRRKNFEKLRAI